MFVLCSSINSSTRPEEPWLVPDKPSNEPFVIRFIVVVFTVAAILILAGAPINNPIAFAMILTFIMGFGLICALLNRELVRELRGAN